MTARVSWLLGGEARVLELTASSITLLSSTPSPPGSRIDAVVQPSGKALRVKVHASRREASGMFRIDGRPIDLSRELREELIKMLEPDAPSTA